VSGQVPPHDLDAEGIVLSTAIVEPSALDELASVVRPDDFYSVPNRTVWGALLALSERGVPVDAVAVASELRERKKLEFVGGTAYVAQLVGGPSVANALNHARTVASLGMRRRLITICQHAAASGYGDVGTTEEWANKLEKSLFDALNASGAEEHSTSPRESIPRIVHEIDLRRRRAYDETAAERVKATYATIPWVKVRNALCGGLRLSKMHVLAGRPGMGKTGAALGFALGAARAGEGVVFISLEMTEDELLQRALSAESGVPLPAISSGEPTQEQWVAITSAQIALDAMPLRIVHAPGETITGIRSRVRREVARLRREWGVATSLVIVDYMQIVDGERQRGDSRETEISTISRRLMTLAGELGVAVLALSQLSREVEKRSNKRPQLSDLRESGAIEQDAFSIVFLYRDGYYKRWSAWVDDVEFIVAKHRNGPLGTVKMAFTGSCVRFDDGSL
jgi:replicative DNA helicase